MIKIESHHAVALLSRLRDATHSTSARHRRTAFNGLRAALKGLNFIERQSDVVAFYEGVDQAGGHWFMAEMKPSESQSGTEKPGLVAQIELLMKLNSELRSENDRLRAERDKAQDAYTRERFPDTTGS